MIPMIDLKRNYHDIKEEIFKELIEVFESGQFILGKKVGQFEQQVKDLLGVRQAVSLASGTDALHIALKALEIGQGDEVITTPFTFFATVEAITYVGARPVFVDIEEESFNINPDLIEDKITKRTKAIIPVHLFGHPSDMIRIMDIARRHGLRVIEDCAQSFGASLKGTMTGSFGDAGCFSFYPSKNLGAFGDGGMIVFNSQELEETIRRLRNHGSLGGYIHEIVGHNSRLDEIQAAVLLVKLRRIRQYNEQRRRCASLYTEFLRGLPIRCPVEKQGAYHVYHQFTIRSTHRDSIKGHLQRAGISSVVYYPIPLHLQKALSYLGHKEGEFPVAEAISREVLSLPIYPELERDDIFKTCEMISEAVKNC